MLNKTKAGLHSNKQSKMKTSFKHIVKSFTILLLTTLSLSSCSKDDGVTKEYLGENKVHLSTQNTVLKNNGEDEISIEILLVKKTHQTITLTFGLEDNQEQGKDILELKNQTITFAPGEKKAVITLKSKTARTITEAKRIKLNLVENNTTIPLEKPLVFTVLPLSVIDELTKEQIALLDGYKEKGLDLYPLLGEINVTTEVKYPGGGVQEVFNLPYTTILTGKTIITLSELATTDKPVLKMTSNAMGLEAYFYKMFRDLTIDDLEFWNNPGPDAPPQNKEVMKSVGLTRTSTESFEVTLNHIAIDINTKEVSFISTLKNLYNDEYLAVPFEFKYSAWDRFKKLLDAGDLMATENYEMGGSINPAHHINVDQIIEDDYDNYTWKESKAKLTDSKFTFEFIFIHNNADGYIQVKTEYKLK